LSVFEGYAAGDYDWTASKDGYLSQTGTVTVVDQNVEVFVAMELAPTTFDIFFWVTDGGPMGLSGVDVTIDGVTVTGGFDGLSVFEGYAAGDYDWTASKDGYVTQTGTVTVVDQNVEVFVAMELAPTTFDIFFWVTEEGNPMGLSGVDVTIDGVTVTSEFDGLALFLAYEPGDYDWTASKTGYVTQSGTVTVVDENVQVFVGMPIMKYSVMFIVEDGTNSIEGAIVSFIGTDGVTNENGEATFIEVPTGSYDYTITMDGYIAESGNVEVNDTDVTVNVFLIIDAIEDNYFSNVSIYPNPAVANINVTNAANSIIRIIDQNGKVIMEEQIINNRETFNLSDKPAGLYHVMLISGEHVSSTKLLIAK